ncbi:Mov34/MPN/PAD-1 family protein [Pleomorphovibrio marinus]|uniref:Mov34/MPN/PAD-1 family protein n=1 Tax=Pleomorphovibrio marinus TaxID=2164132 RepID=UPI0018E5456A|nr:M67 family metallopeptidase [Pleomorphovibrio marinus]
MRLEKWGKEADEEICGFLVGEAKEGMLIIKECLIVKNRAPQCRSSRFLISKEEYMLAEKKATEDQKELLGIFHTHIDQLPIPSLLDVQNAFPGFYYLIYSVYKKNQSQFKTWELNPEIKLLYTLIY